MRMCVGVGVYVQIRYTLLYIYAVQWVAGAITLAFGIRHSKALKFNK